MNLKFYWYCILGVRRRTKEEKDFADFDIFDDPATPYSTFNFTYPRLAFERLSKLTEFNTLLNIAEIKKVLGDSVERLRIAPARFPCTLDRVPLLRRVSVENKRRLSRFLSRLTSGRYSVSDAGKCIDEEPESEDVPAETHKPHRQPAMKYRHKHSPSGLNTSISVDRSNCTHNVINHNSTRSSGLGERLSTPKDSCLEFRPQRGRRPLELPIRNGNCLNPAYNHTDTRYYSALQSPSNIHSKLSKSCES